MLTQGIILGIIIFILDMFIFGKSLVKPQKKLTAKATKEVKKQLELNIPFSLLTQVFFAIILIYSYIFLLTFKVFARGINGGTAFSLLIYIPMLYMYINSWLWGDKDFRIKLAPGIFSWLAKFIVTCIYLGVFI